MVAAELGLQRLHQLASTALATNLGDTLRHARTAAKASCCSYGCSSVCPPGPKGCGSVALARGLWLARPDPVSGPMPHCCASATPLLQAEQACAPPGYRYCREQHGLKCFRHIWKGGAMSGQLSAEDAAAALQDFAPQELRSMLTAVLVAAL
jgi:hypothetical protein